MFVYNVTVILLLDFPAKSKKCQLPGIDSSIYTHMHIHTTRLHVKAFSLWGQLWGLRLKHMEAVWLETSISFDIFPYQFAGLPQYHFQESLLPDSEHRLSLGRSMRKVFE